MTQEEKAKFYDGALERAREAYKNTNNDALKRLIENTFPELRESEDERIRKWIYTCIENLGYPADEDAEKELEEMQPLALAWLEKQKINTEGDFGRGYDCGYEACLNSHGAEWFEKQKENPKTTDSITSNCVSDAKCGNSRHKVGDSLEGRKLADEVVAYLIKSGYQPIIKDTLDQTHFQIKIPRHKEDFFQSTEYKHCREILDEYYYEGDFAGDVYTLYVLRQKEQKIPDCCLKCNEYEIGYKAGYEHGCTAGYNKAMKEVDEQKEQKPAEWSEEDEKIITRLIGYFESFRIAGVATKWEGLDIQEVITLLKSLRSPKSSDNWKPSEEQLKALLNAEGYLREGDQFDSAKSIAQLYEQLKSL